MNLNWNLNKSGHQLPEHTNVYRSRNIQFSPKSERYDGYRADASLSTKKSTAELGFLDCDRVDNQNRESYMGNELFCSVCQNILWKPVCCKTCENAFCSRCIETWSLKKSSQDRKMCPFQCRFESKRPPPILNNLLSKLQIRCAYSENGCREIVPYERLEAHEESCEYEKKPCLVCQVRISHRPTAEKHDLRLCFENVYQKDPNQIQAQFMKLVNDFEASQKRIEALEERIERLER